MNRADGQNLNTASSTEAKTPLALCELAKQHLQEGRTLDAQLCCQQALAADPNFADASYLMGLLSLGAEQADHAVEWFTRAIRRDPKPRYLMNLGTALRSQGRFEEAFKAVDQAVRLDADSPDAWRALGHCLADLKRHHEAALAFREVLARDPRDADAAYQAGFLLFKSGKLETALDVLDTSNNLRANHAPTLQMRALTLQNLGRLEEALAEMQCAQALDPARADICNDLGVVLLRLRRHEAALAWFDKALQLKPDFRLAHNNRAYTLGVLRRFDEAHAVYAALKLADRSDTEPDWNAALLHLLTGNFEAGWREREARWNVPHLPIARYLFAQPRWLGETPIAGKTILIYQDEGLGDVIQFARYLPMVAALGGRIVLLVDAPLVPLLSKLPGVAECIARSPNAAASFDLHCPITSLPLAFGTRLETIPSQVPYLPSPDDARVRAWAQRLGPRQRLRVGIAWSGNLRHMDNENRSLPLRMLLPLLELDATFVSLQKEMKDTDRATLRERPDIVDLTALLTDFTETAALMSCLDLVITVDTSVAHVAGSLARPTWIMLQHTPDWRWLLDREDCPWYPTARLFRQTASGDYTSVVARLRTELNALIAARSPKTDGGGSIAAWTESARSLAAHSRHHEAALAFQEVLRLDPSSADSAYQAGFLLLLSDKPGDALNVLDQSSRLRPDHAPTLQMRSLVLQRLARYDEARAEMARAHALDPDSAEICNDMGVLLRRLFRQEEALGWFDKALKRRPSFKLAQNNKAYSLSRLHRFKEALAIYVELKLAHPEDAEPDWNAALLQLLIGNFEVGWAGREARWRLPGMPVYRGNFSQPMWLGREPLDGKTILIFQDEGLGDAIQFARYVPMVAAMGARVILHLDDPLVPLLSKLSGVVQCIARSSNAYVPFDTYCAIGSLPYAFGTTLETVPATMPYLPAPDQARMRAFEQRLGPHDKLRVGLVWSGNPNYKDDHIRSVSLRALLPLLDLDATFVSLQKNPRPADQATLGERPDIVDLTDHLTDFAETAALMACLDLVISVDTGTAHLAGSLARQTWILLPHTPDWRWLLGRDDSPWYSTARLFRQTGEGDYASVLERVRAALTARIAAWDDEASLHPNPLPANSGEGEKDRLPPA